MQRLLNIAGLPEDGMRDYERYSAQPVRPRSAEPKHHMSTAAAANKDAAIAAFDQAVLAHNTHCQNVATIFHLLPPNSHLTQAAFSVFRKHVYATASGWTVTRVSCTEDEKNFFGIKRKSTHYWIVVAKDHGVIQPSCCTCGISTETGQPLRGAPPLPLDVSRCNYANLDQQKLSYFREHQKPGLPSGSKLCQCGKWLGKDYLAKLVFEDDELGRVGKKIGTKKRPIEAAGSSSSNSVLSTAPLRNYYLRARCIDKDGVTCNTVCLEFAWVDREQAVGLGPLHMIKTC